MRLFIHVRTHSKLHSSMGKVVPIADCLGVYVDAEKPDEFFCIAMEDLSVDFEPCDQVVGISWQECNAMAKKVGEMHAAFWEHDCLKQDIIGGRGKCCIWFESWCHGSSADPTAFDAVFEKIKARCGMEFVSTDNDKLAVALWKKHGIALLTVRAERASTHAPAPGRPLMTAFWLARGERVPT